MQRGKAIVYRENVMKQNHRTAFGRPISAVVTKPQAVQDGSGLCDKWALLTALTQAADALAGVGLTVSDAVRILLTRVASEGGLPAGLTADPDAYDAWFRAKVQEALDNPLPATPHAQAMQDAQALIDRKRRA